MRQLLREAKTRTLASFSARRVTPVLPAPIFTFTFDDVPRSALDNALPLLERAGVSATFYVASWLGDPARPQPADDPTVFFSPNDTRAVRAAGHHVGCHTYSHYSLEHGTAAGLAADAEKNRRELSALLGGEPINHFAYPYGEVSFAAKRLLQNDYLTMRSTRPGINSGTIDLSLLRAEWIYSHLFSREGIDALVASASRTSGWLIFYTHGVENQPNEWGCTPKHLEYTLEACRRASGRFMNVADAYAEVMRSVG
ncbi:MAG: polysaccharide deacetylase family protein [Gemmatimonadota bacterium]